MQSVSAPPVRRALQFGIYRDGDNNLDQSQAVTLAQALTVSAANPSVGFSVEDTTSRHGDGLRTDEYTIADGQVHDAHERDGADMASGKTLAAFVARTLDDAQRSGAAQTWIELSDHGAGDGGGLEADSTRGIMRIDTIAAAIAQGVRMHAQAHPEDAGRGVDGVVANQCLMASLGFSDALSHAGVKYLAASPETMISPGTPTTVAGDIARNAGDPVAMARAVVDDVMKFTYRAGAQSWHPAAAFDVLDLAPQKWSAVESSVRAFNELAARAGRRDAAAIREDAGAIDGMARFPEATPDMPWRADRPAQVLYVTIASDGRLAQNVRDAAAAAASSVAATVLAHAESGGFKPFGGSDFSDAAGPTVHFPVRADQIDPWAPAVSETNNSFYRAVDGIDAARKITTA